MSVNKKDTSSHLVIFSAIGFSVALVIFLFIFITTQKAATPYKYRNLKIPLISPPPRTAIPPLPAGALLVATPSAQTPNVEVEENPATGSAEVVIPSTAPTASP